MRKPYKDGYTPNDRVIRAAQVVVSKAPDDDEVGLKTTVVARTRNRLSPRLTCLNKRPKDE
ncbi:MAG: hypothetical protein R2857_07885 [Vampirovibrionales bacterium]